MDDEIHITELRSLADSSQLAKDWSDLNKSASQPDPFHTLAWYECWIRHFSEQATPLILLAKIDARVIGLFPILITKARRRPWLSIDHVQQDDVKFLCGNRQRGHFLPTHQISGAANLQSMSIRASWIIVPGYEKAFWAAIAKHLEQLKGWDLLILPAVRSEQADDFAATMIANELPTEIRNHALTLYGMRPLPWPDYIQTRTRHFRKRAKAIERSIDKLGNIEIKAIRNKDETPSALHSLFKLGRRSLKEQPRTNQTWHLPLTESTINFHTELAKEYSVANNCVIHEVRCNGELIAGIYSLIDGDRLTALLTYFSPELYKASPGRFLIRVLIDWAGNNGIKWIDFNGNSTLVRMFCTESTEYSQCIVTRSGGYSTFLRELNRISRKLKSIFNRPQNIKGNHE